MTPKEAIASIAEDGRVDQLAHDFWIDWAKGPDGTDNRLHRLLREYGDTRAREATNAVREEVQETLVSLSAYMDGRADADCDQDGYHPNREMSLGQEIDLILERWERT